jgi:hypothetical protein
MRVRDWLGLQPLARMADTLDRLADTLDRYVQQDERERLDLERLATRIEQALHTLALLNKAHDQHVRQCQLWQADVQQAVHEALVLIARKESVH